MAKSESLREANPFELAKQEEAPSNFISGDQLINLLNKHEIKFDDTNIPRFASNNDINMQIRVVSIL